MLKPDFTFSNHGSLWVCTPTSDEAREHLRTHTDDSATWWCGALIVEPRYVVDLAAGLQDEGFLVAHT